MGQFLLFQDKTTGLKKVIYHDPLRRSIYLLRERAKANMDKFNIWVSLTFADTKQVIVQSGRDKGRVYNFDHILAEILRTTFKSIMRRFLNRLKQHFRRLHFKSPISYLWKYEEGKKNGRPHFHILLNVGIPNCKNEVCIDAIKEFIFSRWKLGFVRVSPITNPEKLDDYLKKYFTKGTTLKYFFEGKKWSNSRDIKKPPSQTSDWEYIKPLPYMEAMEIVYNSRAQFVAERGEKLFRFYTWYIGSMIKKEHHRYRKYLRWRKKNELIFYNPVITKSKL